MMNILLQRNPDLKPWEAPKVKFGCDWARDQPVVDYCRKSKVILHHLETLADVSLEPSRPKKGAVPEAESAPKDPRERMLSSDKLMRANTLLKNGLRARWSGQSDIKASISPLDMIAGPTQAFLGRKLEFQAT